jgi:hypothetical protein
MNIIQYNNYLEEEDTKLLHIQQLIHKKRQFLLKKQKHLKNMEKQNHFLQEIRKDYFNYNDYIVKQKQDQIHALELLNQYLADLTKSGYLTTNNIDDAKQEQIKIVKELKKLKYGLDKIIQDTNDINLHLNNYNRTKTI